MKVLYFARFRQIIGRSADEISVPGDVTTVQDLLSHLISSDANIASAFADLRTVKVAVDQNHCALDASIVGAKEVAFFPPVTGG
jgi:molybdopterin synthase sulfur carrier subunit